MTEKLPADEAKEWADEYAENETDLSFSMDGKLLHDHGRCAVVLEFSSLSDLVAWFQEAKGIAFPVDASLFMQDAIDKGRLNDERCLVAKRKADRSDRFRLKAERVVEEDI